MKYGAGEGWRSVGSIMREMKECYKSVKEERNIVHTVKRRKANWIGHILRRNCFLKHTVEGNIEGKDRSQVKTRNKT
jgi:hypothetical protein